MSRGSGVFRDLGFSRDDGDTEYFLQHKPERINKAEVLEKAWFASQIKEMLVHGFQDGLFHWAWHLSSLLVRSRESRWDVVSHILDIETS
jgi:hypothetical protein